MRARHHSQRNILFQARRVHRGGVLHAAVRGWTADDVAARVAGFGAAFAKYAEVAKETLKQESLQIQTEELAKAVVKTVLNDDEVFRRAISFLRQAVATTGGVVAGGRPNPPALQCPTSLLIHNQRWGGGRTIHPLPQ